MSPLSPHGTPVLYSSVPLKRNVKREGCVKCAEIALDRVALDSFMLTESTDPALAFVNQDLWATKNPQDNSTDAATVPSIPPVVPVPIIAPTVIQSTTYNWRTPKVTTTTARCGGVVHHTRVFTNPYGTVADLKITATDVDDGLLLNDVRIGTAGLEYCMTGWPGGPWECQCGFSGYSAQIPAHGSFELKVIDLVAGFCWANLNVNFSRKI